jgi:hypothetical protein
MWLVSTDEFDIRRYAPVGHVTVFDEETSVCALYSFLVTLKESAKLSVVASVPRMLHDCIS